MLEFLNEIKKEVPSDDSAEEGEKLLLYGLIRALKPKVCVETGTHKGLATLYMAHALYDNGEGHITTADPFEWGAMGNFRKFPELEAHITTFKGKGCEVEVKDIDFLFVDGFHEKAEVEAEIKHLFPRLNKGAVVLFHDCHYGNEPNADVNAAVKDLKTLYLTTHNRIRMYVH